MFKGCDPSLLGMMAEVTGHVTSVGTVEPASLHEKLRKE